MNAFTDINDALKEGPYDVILSDPPWFYYGDPNKMAAAGKHYPLMKDEEVSNLPVNDLLAKTGVMFVWTTSSVLERTMKCINDWGLNYQGIAFVWIKTKQDGTPMGARGVRPTYVKPLTELVLVASKVKKGRPMTLHDESIKQTVFAPVGKHSEKPLEVHSNIEKMYPAAKRLEMFARQPQPNWTCWGNQVLDKNLVDLS